MSYAVEFIKFEDGRAEPVAVVRLDGPFATIAKAHTEAVIMFATLKDNREIVAYRILDGDGEVVTTRVRGIG